MSTYVDTATLEDANITFTEVEKRSLFTTFVVHIDLSKEWPCPFSPLLSLSSELVSLIIGVEDIRGTHPELYA